MDLTLSSIDLFINFYKFYILHNPHSESMSEYERFGKFLNTVVFYIILSMQFKNFNKMDDLMKKI